MCRNFKRICYTLQLYYYFLHVTLIFLIPANFDTAKIIKIEICKCKNQTYSYLYAIIDIEIENSFNMKLRIKKLIVKINNCNDFSS